MRSCREVELRLGLCPLQKVLASSLLCTSLLPISLFTVSSEPELLMGKLRLGGPRPGRVAELHSC